MATTKEDMIRAGLVCRNGVWEKAPKQEMLTEREALPSERRIKQEQEPGLNKLETAFLGHLQINNPKGLILCQSIRFRLANGIWYKPDFVLILPEEVFKMTCYEVKGPKAWRGGFENLKVAASTFPHMKWILTWKDASGVWTTQRVVP